MIENGFKVLLTLATSAVLSGCISMQSYVDPVLPPATKEHVKAVAKPEPIQVLYEFRSKGEVNAAATQQTSPIVMEVMRNSGLFTEVSTAPVANQRRITFTIENVPVTSESDAKAKGFATGLTLGLAGTMVTDGYKCDATLTVPGAEPTKVGMNHALHTTIGNASGPPGLKGQKPIDAIREIVSQLTWSVLRDFSNSGRL